ncbi:MAG: hypothetical protein WC763_02490 [Candidatus Paceibacterota bacterium]|jgi:hypothetical protein
MIPESLRKQNRALELELAGISGRTLSDAEKAELEVLRIWADGQIRSSIRDLQRMNHSMEAHRKKTAHISIGTYAAAA